MNDRPAFLEMHASAWFRATAKRTIMWPTIKQAPMAERREGTNGLRMALLNGCTPALG
jgi:hypothetical protein